VNRCRDLRLVRPRPNINSKGPPIPPAKTTNPSHGTSLPRSGASAAGSLSAARDETVQNLGVNNGRIEPLFDDGVVTAAWVGPMSLLVVAGPTGARRTVQLFTPRFWTVSRVALCGAAPPLG
jgi:hypothetical protein